MNALCDRLKAGNASIEQLKALNRESRQQQWEDEKQKLESDPDYAAKWLKRHEDEENLRLQMDQASNRHLREQIRITISELTNLGVEESDLKK